MSEISENTAENIDEVEQISLLITCNTKLHKYYLRGYPTFCGFSPKVFFEISTHTPFYQPPFITFATVLHKCSHK